MNGWLLVVGSNNVKKTLNINSCFVYFFFIISGKNVGCIAQLDFRFSASKLDESVLICDGWQAGWLVGWLGGWCVYVWLKLKISFLSVGYVNLFHQTFFFFVFFEQSKRVDYFKAIAIKCIKNAMHANINNT